MNQRECENLLDGIEKMKGYSKAMINLFDNEGEEILSRTLSSSNNRQVRSLLMNEEMAKLVILENMYSIEETVFDKADRIGDTIRHIMVESLSDGITGGDMRRREVLRNMKAMEKEFKSLQLDVDILSDKKNTTSLYLNNERMLHYLHSLIMTTVMVVGLNKKYSEIINNVYKKNEEFYDSIETIFYRSLIEKDGEENKVRSNGCFAINRMINHGDVTTKKLAKILSVELELLANNHLEEYGFNITKNLFITRKDHLFSEEVMKDVNNEENLGKLKAFFNNRKPMQAIGELFSQKNKKLLNKIKSSSNGVVPYHEFNNLADKKGCFEVNLDRFVEIVEFEQISNWLNMFANTERFCDKKAISYYGYCSIQHLESTFILRNLQQSLKESERCSFLEDKKELPNDDNVFETIPLEDCYSYFDVLTVIGDTIREYYSDIDKERIVALTEIITLDNTVNLLKPISDIEKMKLRHSITPLMMSYLKENDMELSESVPFAKEEYFDIFYVKLLQEVMKSLRFSIESDRIELDNIKVLDEKRIMERNIKALEDKINLQQKALLSQKNEDSKLLDEKVTFEKKMKEKDIENVKVSNELEKALEEIAELKAKNELLQKEKELMDTSIQMLKLTKSEKKEFDMEKALELINQRPVTMVGGFPKWAKKVQELIPNMTYLVAEELGRSYASVRNENAIVLYVSGYNNHSSFDKFNNNLDKNATLIQVDSNSSNLERLIKQIYNEIK